jgi:hypothetical protein
LAGIHELQKRRAEIQKQLNEEWDAVRDALLNGCEIEAGPLRAWMQCSVRLASGRQAQRSSRCVLKRLRVL